MAKMAMLNDVSKCMACRACQIACKEWNELPAETTRNWGSYENPPHLTAHTWTRVSFRETTGSEVEWVFMKYQCMHCTIAPCVNNCPTGAMHKVNDNFVVVNQEWCIGCRYCVMSCPFNVVQFDAERGVAAKCTFCIDRVSNGLRPACAKACPTGAIEYGERDMLLAKAQQRVAYLQSNGFPEAQVYGDTQLGGLHVIYVLTHAPEFYRPAETPDGLPQAPVPRQEMTLLPNWLSGAVAAGALVSAPFWWVIKRRQEMATQGGETP